MFFGAPGGVDIDRLLTDFRKHHFWLPFTHFFGNPKNVKQKKNQLSYPKKKLILKTLQYTRVQSDAEKNSFSLSIQK